MASESLTSRLLELLGAVGAELVRRATPRTVLILAAFSLALVLLWWVSSREVARALNDVDPERELEQAVREADGLLEDVRARLGKLVAAKHLANKHLMEATRKHRELSAQVDLALQNERDDLAQAAIGGQLEIEAQVSALEQSLATASAAEDDLQAYASALLRTRRDMQAELETLQNMRREQESQRLTASSAETYRGIKMAHAESALEGASGRHAGPLYEDGVLDAKAAVRLAGLEKVTRDKRIHERLSALKAQRRAEDGK